MGNTQTSGPHTITLSNPTRSHIELQVEYGKAEDGQCNAFVTTLGPGEYQTKHTEESKLVIKYLLLDQGDPGSGYGTHFRSSVTCCEEVSLIQLSDKGLYQEGKDLATGICQPPFPPHPFTHLFNNSTNEPPNGPTEISPFSPNPNNRPTILIFFLFLD